MVTAILSEVPTNVWNSCSSLESGWSSNGQKRTARSPAEAQKNGHTDPVPDCQHDQYRALAGYSFGALPNVTLTVWIFPSSFIGIRSGRSGMAIPSYSTQAMPLLTAFGFSMAIS